MLILYALKKIVSTAYIENKILIVICLKSWTYFQYLILHSKARKKFSNNWQNSFKAKAYWSTIYG